MYNISESEIESHAQEIALCVSRGKLSDYYTLNNKDYMYSIRLRYTDGYGGYSKWCAFIPYVLTREHIKGVMTALADDIEGFMADSDYESEITYSYGKGVIKRGKRKGEPESIVTVNLEYDLTVIQRVPISKNQLSLI